MKSYLAILISLLILIACGDEFESQSNLNDEEIESQLFDNYELLPERAISKSLDNSVYAQYAMPTEKYGHGILGDKIEAEQLVVVVDGVFYEHTLPNAYVFEDIRPRLYDVDDDNQLEFITIRTHVTEGAGIVIYKIINEALVEYANVPEIGTSYRWLNIVSIDDLDNDGNIELAWIQTPHIGGILKVARIREGAINVLAEKSQYSNHAIGEKNLCLSVLSEQLNEKIIYVPSQDRKRIVGFTFQNDNLSLIEEVQKSVDFSQTLHSQYDFINPIDDKVNCISDQL